ncbi:MAG: ABC transporter permease [Planctomycetota bacterium]|nr:ABC transporter permease [Planctomycetota bacterium]
MIIIRVLMQTVLLAFGHIRANKVRAFLTALGIIIGVASVTSVIAGLTGMKRNVMEQFESLGAKKMWVWGDVPRSMRGQLDWNQVKIQEAEIEAIAAHCPSIEKLTPMVNLRYTVEAGPIAIPGVQVTGIWPSWHEIEDRYVTLGRPFIPVDEETARQVCLINEAAIDELLLDRDPVGDSITVGGRRFLIVGVVETKDVGMMFGGGETRAEVFVPYATAGRVQRWHWPYLMLQITDAEAADDARAEVRFVLRTMRELSGEDLDTFGMEILQQHIDRFNAVAAGITTVAGGVVSISLLVGGIGIMNIMLVSVSERTREIGLRKAVGAKSSVILLQFLTEAVVLCLVGGLIGIILGQTFTLLMQQIPDAGLESAKIPAWAILLAFAFSAGVGVVFGMFPAIKAARLHPIQALRHE